MILNERQMMDMKEGGTITAAILRELAGMAKPGISTAELDARARQLIQDAGAKPSFLGYRGYPAVLCSSINEEAVHSVPSDRMLREGDLLKLDFGVLYKGLHTDAAITVLVSDREPDSDEKKKEYKEKRRQIETARQALYAGIKAAQVGSRIGHISEAIQKTVQEAGYTVIKELGGHGIGTVLHDEPFVANFGFRRDGEPLKEGMALALEPIVSSGKDWRIKDAPDGFGYLTRDGGLVTHFEHTIIITKTGPIIATE